MNPIDQPLTRSMQPVIEAVGFDAALRMAAHFGGTRVLVVRSPDERDPISRAIGVECARRLATAIGGGIFDVPRCVTWLLARRNEEVVARYLAGESQAELALRFVMTERHIRNILNDDAPAASSPNLDLFSAEEGAAP